MNRPMTEFNDHLTEQDLIALQLGELTPERARAVKRAVQQNPALAAEEAAMAAIFGRMKGAPLPVDAGLLDRNWKALRPSLAAHTPQPARWASWRKPVFAGLLLASAAVAGYLASQWGSASTPQNALAESSAGSKPAQAPGSTTNLRQAPLGAEWKVRLGAGVYHPAAGGSGSPIRMLGLATTTRGLEAIPVRPRFGDALPARQPLNGRPEMAALNPSGEVGPGPLTEKPVAAGTSTENTAGFPMRQGNAAGAIGTGKRGRRESRIETTVSLGASGQFTAQRAVRSAIGDDVGYQQLNKADGVVGTVGQSFRPWLGYTVNFGYARTIENNVGNHGTYFGSFPIALNAYELSVAYTVRKRVRPKLTAFADVGGGVLTFLPVHRGATAKDYVPFQSAANVPSVDFRPLAVAAAGVEYHVKTRLGVRVEYRGLLYKMPDFGELVGKALTVTSEPVVSVTYRFGGQ